MYVVHIFVNTSDITNIIDKFGEFELIDLSTYTSDDNKRVSFTICATRSQLVEITNLIYRYDCINFSFYKKQNEH